MIIRAITLIFGTFILYVLQTGLFSSFSLAGVVPDLLMILVVSTGYMHGRIRAMITGLLCGFFIDCCYGNVIGVFPIFYIIVGNFSGFANKIYDDEDHMTPILLTAAGELLYNIMFFIVFYLLQGRTNLSFYIYRITIPKIVYTVLVSIILYRILRLINNFLLRFDKTEE
ncbi:MAG: rod shape-determining protein MreD [Lachnospiraceae bacterium]|nr:rod shape-determining protein MreD [Lachnospiraceae bacterium]